MTLGFVFGGSAIWNFITGWKKQEKVIQ